MADGGDTRGIRGGLLTVLDGSYVKVYIQTEGMLVEGGGAKALEEAKEKDYIDDLGVLLCTVLAAAVIDCEGNLEEGFVETVKSFAGKLMADAFGGGSVTFKKGIMVDGGSDLH